MAARRTEELLRAALRVPDRIPYAEKRAVRSALPATEAERAAEVRELHARAVALPRLAGVAAAGALRRGRPRKGFRDRGGFGGVPVRWWNSFRAGASAGSWSRRPGPTLHLAVGGRGVVVLDTRLMTGWELLPSEPAAAGCAFPVREFRREPDGLF